ncbi:MAG TPA: hypothetical protein VKZ84_00335 [Bacteriovoracaceae bacterium]|nr:hypothetical protein [Bacteriovoracaceae bacterium]
MFARNPESKNPQNFPADWIEGFSRLLNSTYKSDCTKNQRFFDVYGQIYSEELLVVISYLSEVDEAMTPVTLFLSCDKHQMDTEEKAKSTQKNFIDLAGLFFDEILKKDDEVVEFEPVWQEVAHNKETYHYKLTRENITLTLKANELLGDEFLDD